MAQRPTLKADPDGWERAWQVELARRYPAHRTRLPSRLSDMRPLAAMAMTPSSRANAAAQFKELCILQADLTRMASEKCATADFEGEWRRSKPEDRKRHYMAAMVAVCSIFDMEKQRAYSPEVTLAVFEAGKGQGYLDILRKLIAFDSGKSFVHLENPLVESMLGIKLPVDTSGEHPSDPMIHLQKSFIANRTFFITLVVWNILLSFYGESETLLSVKSAKETKLTPEKVALLKGLGTTSDMLATTVADWKTGKPPHKTVCGQPEALLEALRPPGTHREWEPAVPGFRRSPALLHQMRFLDENPSYDYFFVQPYPLNDYGLVIPDPVDKTVFLMNRRGAFNSGDIPSLKMMFQQLAPCTVSVPGMSLELLRKQFLNEYGVDMAKVP
ncbi:hypothetical protein HWV62_1412 [Athelia sp. TMB]|nr:hypothetical protein HWV62_1412 [Athelia sp. TMB]